MTAVTNTTKVKASYRMEEGSTVAVCISSMLGYLRALKLFFFLSDKVYHCLLYTSPSPRDRQKSRMPSSA